MKEIVFGDGMKKKIDKIVWKTPASTVTRRLTITIEGDGEGADSALERILEALKILSQDSKREDG